MAVKRQYLLLLTMYNVLSLDFGKSESRLSQNLTERIKNLHISIVIYRFVKIGHQARKLFCVKEFFEHNFKHNVAWFILLSWNLSVSWLKIVVRTYIRVQIYLKIWLKNPKILNSGHNYIQRFLPAADKAFASRSSNLNHNLRHKRELSVFLTTRHVLVVETFFGLKKK